MHPNSHTTEKLRALIVEDEDTLAEAYRIILEKSGYETKIACDGEEGLEFASSFLPDVILLDLRMPRMDGLEFLQAFKELDTPKRPKIIVFSNLDTQKEIDQAYALGADKFILKAWASPKDLVRIVKDVLDEEQS